MNGDSSMIDGLILTPMKIIGHPKGDLYHVIKSSSIGFRGFGESYISSINMGEVKGWKKHHKMTMNIVIPKGEVCIAIFDDRPTSLTRNSFYEVKLSINNYARLTIPPNLWAAFLGNADDGSIILNVADFEHNESESDSLDFIEMPYVWKGC